MSNSDKKQPNILVFLTDDHPRWGVGCYGNPVVRTPSLDFMSQNGARFDNAFCPAPVCSPSRASFFTGRVPSQHGIHDFLGSDDPNEDRDWMAEEQTLAMILQSAGYHTGLSGKWHAGRDDEHQKGFDFYFGISKAYPYVHEGPRQFSDHGTLIEKTGHVTSTITDQAIHFLRDHDQSKPFFLSVGYIGTHSPWAGHPERLVSYYRQFPFDEFPDDITYPHAGLFDELIPPGRYHAAELRAQFYASVTHIDEQVGRVMDELRALGQLENTVLIYTSDHGLNLGQHGIWGKANGTIPSNMVEESIRIPLIIHYPNEIRPGVIRGEYVDLTDLFATILDYGRITLPDDRMQQQNYPGESFRLLASGRHIPSWKKVQCIEYGNLRLIHTGQFKLTRRYPDGPAEFFDLKADPREVHNLIDHPAHQETIQALTSQMEAFYASHEISEKSGLNILEQPAHNPIEPWRDGWQDKYDSDYRAK